MNCSPVSWSASNSDTHSDRKWSQRRPYLSLNHKAPRLGRSVDYELIVVVDGPVTSSQVHALQQLCRNLQLQTQSAANHVRLGGCVQW